MKKHFHIESKPYSIIDAYNRMCLALGSATAAVKGAHADYNGHHYTVIKTARGYYTCTYTWAGINTVQRGSVLDCAIAAAKYANGPKLGASASLEVNEADLTPEIEDAILKLGFVPGKAGARSWWTWRHQIAARSAPDSAARRDNRVLRIFDAGLLEQAESPQDYAALVADKYNLVIRHIPANVDHW